MVPVTAMTKNTHVVPDVTFAREDRHRSFVREMTFIHEAPHPFPRSRANGVDSLASRRDLSFHHIGPLDDEKRRDDSTFVFAALSLGLGWTD